jgi:hypothetical protein
MSWPTHARPDDKAKLRDAFKYDRPLYDRMINPYRETQERKQEQKTAWREKNMSRAEKQERADAQKAADAKHKDAMEAVREFNDAGQRKNLGRG